MKIVVFTSNAIRHKFVANTLAQKADQALIVSECIKNDAADSNDVRTTHVLQEHFRLRYETEQRFFAGNDFFFAPTLPLNYREVNLSYTFQVISNFEPDLMFVFGASLIKEPLLSLLPPGRFVNLHLGLSPYYRGSGTNFWPFVNEELEYVGSTLLHIDPGVDTGDIIAHVRPVISTGDTVHSVGCKVIEASASALGEIMDMVREGKPLNRVKQWPVPQSRYYRAGDFNETVLATYQRNLHNGLINQYLNTPNNPPRLVDLS